MILAYHLIISAYGFWLPNDPRGSWSDFVRAYELAAFGPATKINTRQSVAPRPHDRTIVRQMKTALAHSPVIFTGQQARAIAAGFTDYCRRSGLAVHACAIQPTHTHLVVARHHLSIERTCEQLKAAATTQLNLAGLHPFADEPYKNSRRPTPWARKGWWVFLDSSDDIHRSINYVNQNPVKANLPAQCWKSVTPYNPEGHFVPPAQRAILPTFSGRRAASPMFSG
ncbi:MAG: transposase [Phycisphaerales bacterium]